MAELCPQVRLRNLTAVDLKRTKSKSKSRFTSVGRMPAKQGPSPPASHVYENSGTEVKADPISAAVPAPLNKANGQNHGGSAGGHGDKNGHFAADEHQGVNAGVDHGGQGSQAKPPYSRSVGKTPGIYLPVEHEDPAESHGDKEPWINLKPNDHVVYKGERLGLFYGMSNHLITELDLYQR
jgi:hypothetical protein